MSSSIPSPTRLAQPWSEPQEAEAVRACSPDASIVICAYTQQRRQALLGAVAAASSQSPPPGEVIVVIDHNPALLADIRRTLSASVCVIANEEQRGLSGCRNTGVRHARGEVVVFLDDDAHPTEGWLAALLAPFEDQRVIGVGGIARPAWDGSEPSWLPREFHWVVGCSYTGLPSSQSEIRNPIGANMAFRRAVFERVGGFVHGIGRVGRTPLGCEETEFAIRAAAVTGGRILHVPGAIVNHAVSADRTRPAYFAQRCWAEGISKAAVARSVGQRQAISSERAYVLSTLPAAIAAGLRDAVEGDRSGLSRAVAIAAGLGITSLGYLRGRLAAPSLGAPAGTPAPQPADQAPGGQPLWSGEVDLADAHWPSGPLLTSTGRPFPRARMLVRAAGTPLGFVELELEEGRIDPRSATERARRAHGQAAERELRLQADAGAGRVPYWRSGSQELVSVVVCTRDRPGQALRCVAALRELAYASIEILVIDNAPRDDSTRLAIAPISARDPRVRYIREPRPGLSHARNRALREALGSVIAYTDDDVVADRLWIDGLLRGFGRAPGVGCVTGMVASASLEHPAERFFDSRVWWSSSCTPRVFDLRSAGASRLHPYAAGIFGTGANFAFDRELLRALGGFDESLGAGAPTAGGEDLDIFVRLLRAGRLLCYEPCALVWHEHRVDAALLRRQMHAYGKGLTAYLTKYLLCRRTGPELLGRSLCGLGHAASLIKRSDGSRAQTGLRGDLLGAELLGMLCGPAAYVRARRRQEPARRREVSP